MKLYSIISIESGEALYLEKIKRMSAEYTREREKALTFESFADAIDLLPAVRDCSTRMCAVIRVDGNTNVTVIKAS